MRSSWWRMVVAMWTLLLVACQQEEAPPSRQPPQQAPRVVKKKVADTTPPQIDDGPTATPPPKKEEDIPSDSALGKTLVFFQREPREEQRELKVQELLSTMNDKDVEVCRKALLTGEAMKCRASISLLVGYYVNKAQSDKVDDIYQQFFSRCDPRAQDPRDWVTHARSLLMGGNFQRALSQVNEAEKRAPNLPRGVELQSFQADVLEVRARAFEGMFKGAVANFEESATVRLYWSQANQNWTAYRNLFQDKATESPDAAGRVGLAEEHLSWLADQSL